MKQIIPFNDLSRFFNSNFWENDFNWSDLGKMFPSVDVEETKREIIVKADLPNVKTKDLEVEIEDCNLIIKGKTDEEKEEKKKNFFRMERNRGNFYRRLKLPCRINSKKVTAKSKNGMLTINLPKEKVSEPKLKIKVDVKEN